MKRRPQAEIMISRKSTIDFSMDSRYYIKPSTLQGYFLKLRSIHILFAGLFFDVIKLNLSTQIKGNVHESNYYQTVYGRPEL